MTPINPVNWQVTSAPVNLVDMWAADLLSSLADWSATSTPVNLDDQLTNSLPHIEISGHNMNWHFDPRPVNPSGRNFHTQTYWAWTPYPEWPLVHQHSSLQDYSDCSSPKHDNWYSIGPCSHLFGAMSGLFWAHAQWALPVYQPLNSWIHQQDDLLWRRPYSSDDRNTGRRNDWPREAILLHAKPSCTLHTLFSVARILRAYFHILAIVWPTLITSQVDNPCLSVNPTPLVLVDLGQLVGGPSHSLSLANLQSHHTLIFLYMFINFVSTSH